MARVNELHYAAALDFANEVRKAIGKRPVKRLKKGVPRKASCCTIARTIDPDGNVSIIDLSGSGAEAKLGYTYRPHRDRKGNLTRKIRTRNTRVRTFIRAFDRKEIPELID